MKKYLVALAVIAAACGGSSAESPSTTVVTDASEAPSETTTTSTTASNSTPDPTPSGPLTSEGLEIPPAPVAPTGPTPAELAADLDTLFTILVEENRVDEDAVRAVAEHEDARTAWLFTDLLRFTRLGEASDTLVGAYQRVTGVTLPFDQLGGQWKGSLDYLIAWDLPALEDYVSYKARLYVAVEPLWEPFFADEDAAIDWRLVSWGGVFLDDRPLGVRDGCPRGCIPALDDPLVTDAAGGDWLDDDSIVFGVTVNGESRAYPKHQMETHEMVNDTLGGRRLGIPYCTLCGSAQAYLTDAVPEDVETPVLRTSGLLSRSNKVMFDWHTNSIFDTFTGEGLSGPLQGLRLEQVTVVASTWGAWKEDHPDTTIVAQDGGIGFFYQLDPLGGRDDDGPIFPIGDVDPRLPVSEQVIGVELPDGSQVAFPKRAAQDHLAAGGTVSFGDITVVADGTGLRALDADGNEVVAHEAFWFAWSQFWPDTALWEAP